ncbi:hypothetical protein H0H87_007660 [Tephrocybe sp. NHM501043]|nr:hypothetical protein H0H87_007660 [Tephrocybe sp. NHM501043]
MSTATTTPAKPKSSKKDKKREASDRAHVGGERLKTVIRRLPPNLPEEIFWGSVSQWISDESVSWKTYYPGKLKTRMNKENIPSRAYIAFKNEEVLARFGKEYDGHLFKDKAGNEYTAIVEFSPYQKVPSDKKKVDARNATIEKDDDYLSFIASLKAAESAEPPSLESLIVAAQPAPPPKTTPLLEALKAEKSANKDKEAILRSHAHYKDPTILQPPSRSDAGSKKKGGASSAPAKSAPAPEPSNSKKGGKKGQAQGAKQPSQAHASTKSAPGTSNAGQGQNTKAPKHPKPAKQAQQQPSKATPASAPTPVSAPTPPIVLANAGPTKASAAAANTGEAAPAPRRSRPVIGLASRQFEAALSGVAGGPGRARREQASHTAKEGSEASSSTPTAPPASGGGAGSGGSKHSTPRGKHVKDGSKDGPKDATKEGAHSKGNAQTPAPQPVGEGQGQSSASGRGGRRGRGRGGGGGGAGGRGGAAPRGG